MQSSEDSIPIAAHILHDVNFSTNWPLAAIDIDILRQHPDCRPQARATGQLCAEFIPSICPT